MITAIDRGGVVRLGYGVLRERGLRESARKVEQYVSAMWHLRHATVRGTVLLEGRAKVENRGNMRFGDRVRLNGTTVRLEFVCSSRGSLAIGNNTFINYGTNISAVESVRIGNNCSIGQYSIIMDCDYHDAMDHAALGAVRPVVIEDDVWLGARTIVLKGARIGRGAVIGANSVVKGEIPPYALAAGSPARVIRRLEAPADE